METLELPIVEEREESTPWQEFEMDSAAFQLWREACCLDNASGEDPQAVE